MVAPGRSTIWPLHDLAEERRWGDPRHKAGLDARMQGRPGYGTGGKGRADLRADELMSALHQLLVDKLGGPRARRAGGRRPGLVRRALCARGALVVRLIGMALQPEHGRPNGSLSSSAGGSAG